ncbi:uroporphyrinogen-III synthase [Aquicoccus sp. G2-2]|uniref:uroporphyrinogen-III synthase n=1 Tax=Aquicoccus sp. G2-2 TaxID=3092120 RepID=UPI002ADF24C3|nr:uroporphyrinogen-III synthase [Aquicoccus sp. G2-2]MEA1114748.1 uroporphyrinogen-III synthase [Aquicoccus sp. G2-2]
MPAILLTRPEAASEQYATRLKARLGAVEIVCSPLLRIEFRAAQIPPGEPVFTSRNGVEAFCHAQGQPGGSCWCVGEATAEAAKAVGFNAKAAGGDADSLVAAIRKSGESGPFVHMRGVHARGDLAQRLRAGGCAVDEVVLYDQHVQELSAAALTLLECEKPVIVPLFSPRTAAQFAQARSGEAPLYVAAMSAAVAEALGHMPLAALAIAQAPSVAAMDAAVESLFGAALRLEAEQGAQ